MDLVPAASRTARRFAVLCTLAGLAASVHAQDAFNPATRTLKWSSGQTTTVAVMSPSQVAQRIDQLAARTDASRVLVHFAYPIEEQDRALLKQLGLDLTTALGGTSYFATLDAGADHIALSRANIASITPIDRQQKLHRDLEGGIYNSWMIDHEAVAKSPLGAKLIDSGMVSDAELTQLGIDPEVIVIAMLHPDVNRADALKDISTQFGARVINEVRSLNAASIQIKASQVKALAELDRVMWVEPPLPAALDENNAENRALTGVNTVNAALHSLSGDGVTVLVYDAGQAFAHQDYASRLTIGASDTDSISGHATHVAGTVGGDGTGNINHRGMASALISSATASRVVGGLQPGFLYTDPGDLESDYLEAFNLYGADISNNSIGSNVESNGYNCDWQGDYGTTASLIDAIVRGSMGSPFRIVWAAGNERQGTRCNIEGFGDYYSVAPPAGPRTTSPSDRSIPTRTTHRASPRGARQTTADSSPTSPRPAVRPAAISASPPPARRTAIHLLRDLDGIAHHHGHLGAHP
ncbi:MAG: S8 family serine peptidase [Phycisphaerales bacterium]